MQKAGVCVGGGEECCLQAAEHELILTHCLSYGIHVSRGEFLDIIPGKILLHS